MISTFLPIHAADAVTLDFGVFIAEQARTHRVSQTAIIAALRPCITSSQPATSQAHAPAADTPASQAAGDQTDGETSPKPSSPSVEPIPEAPKPLPDAPDNPADALSHLAEAKTSVQADGGAVSAVKGANARLESADGAEPPPSKISLRDRIVAKHREHPEWPAKLLARACDTSEEQVRTAAQKRKLIIPSWWDYQRKQKAKTTEALRKPPKAEKAGEAAIPTPEPKPQPAAKPSTLAQRLADYVADHPNATAREVADALGAKLTSISWAAQKAGVTLRKFDSAERSAATRRGIAANKPTKPSAPAEKPSSPFAPADIGEEPRKIKRPAKTRFYLREKLGQGQFLHMSGQGLTDKRIYAWIGTEQQLIAARKAFDVARDLVEEVAL